MSKKLEDYKKLFHEYDEFMDKNSATMSEAEYDKGLDEYLDKMDEVWYTCTKDEKELIEQFCLIHMNQKRNDQN